MTPCFLHTPNMTNKWNNFKPNIENGGQADNEEQKQIEFITDKLFVESKQIQGIQHTKKPMTSHQSKNLSITGNRLGNDNKKSFLLNSEKKHP